MFCKMKICTLWLLRFELHNESLSFAINKRNVWAVHVFPSSASINFALTYEITENFASLCYKSPLYTTFHYGVCALPL